MDGLVPGRIVLFVFNAEAAAAMKRRRTDSAGIRDMMEAGRWPVGAQAHIGNPIVEGQIAPAMVVAVHSPTSVNLKVFLDGSDVYWATSVGYDDGIDRDTYKPYSWHWMFEKQATRYTPGEAEIRKIAGDEFNGMIPRLIGIIDDRVAERSVDLSVVAAHVAAAFIRNRTDRSPNGFTTEVREEIAEASLDIAARILAKALQA